MALPRKKRRRIHVNGRDYFWFFPTGRDGGNQVWSAVTIQPAEGGQLLMVKTGAQQVTPELIRTFIVEALALGWGTGSAPLKLALNVAPPR